MQRTETKGAVIERLPLWRQLSWRLGAAFLLLTAIGSLTSSFLQYKAQDRRLRRSLGDPLLNISRTGALLIDGDLHQAVVEKGRNDTAEHLAIRNQLRKIQATNGLKEPLYTLVDIQGEEAKFAVISHGDESVGKPYKLAPEIQPILRTVLTEKTSAYTDIYENEHGAWMTAFAPVLNTAGQIVAVLDVDYRADMYITKLGTIRRRLFAHSLSAALLAMAAGFFLAKQITRPVAQLTAAARKVLEGDLTSEIRVSSRDEVGLLSEVFNHMVAGLREGQVCHSAQERMGQEMDSARVIQQSFLPDKLPGADDPRFKLAVVNHPAAAVGGDYYDVVPLGRDRLGVVVGDVSGKGIPGALYMARLVSDFRFLVDPHEDTPAETLTKLNRILVERGQQGMFVTLLYLTLNLDSGLVTYANAGHPPILVRRNVEGVDVIDHDVGPPLGITDDIIYSNGEASMAPGDSLLLFTDGVTEAMNPSRDFFTYERLVKVVRNAPSWPESLTEAVIGAVQAFSGDAPVHDDITLLTVRWEGGSVRREKASCIIKSEKATPDKVTQSLAHKAI